MKILDIGKVSEETGIPPSTLRYYEEIGLIDSIGRRGLRRQFAPETLLRLALISMGQSAGFTLEEVSGVLGSNGRPDLPRAELHAKADEIDRQIKNLNALSKVLRHVADCPAPSHMECPTFRRLLSLASRRRRRAAKHHRDLKN